MQKTPTECHTEEAEGFLKKIKLFQRIPVKASDYEWYAMGSNLSAIMVKSREKVKGSLESRMKTYFWSQMWVHVLIRRDSMMESSQIFPIEVFNDSLASASLGHSLNTKDFPNFHSEGLKIPIPIVNGDDTNGKSNNGVEHHFRKKLTARVCLHPWEKGLLKITLKNSFNKQQPDCLFGHIMLRFSRNCTREKGSFKNPDFLGFCKRHCQLFQKEIHLSVFLHKKPSSIFIGLPQMYIITAEFVINLEMKCRDISLHFDWEDYKQPHKAIFITFNKKHSSWEEAHKLCNDSSFHLPFIHSEKDAENLLDFLSHQVGRVVVYKSHIIGTALIFIGLLQKVRLYILCFCSLSLLEVSRWVQLSS